MAVSPGDELTEDEVQATGFGSAEADTSDAYIVAFIQGAFGFFHEVRSKL